MAAGRKIEDEGDARACLKAAKGDLRGWARAHGVDGRSLNAWRVNLARRSATAPPARRRATAPRLVELVPTPTTRPPARYRVRVAGLDLEFDDGFDPDAVARLVRALRSC